jgi:hypothetical protein
MADTDELFRRIKRTPGVKYTALWLNDEGFRKALRAHQVDIDPRLLCYPSDAFSRNNNNASSLEMRDRQRDWVRLYQQEGFPLDAAYIMTAFGCNFEGPIPQERVLDDFRFVLQLCEEEGIPVPILVIADTMGWGNPEAVKRLIGAVRDLAPSARIGMHLHDTRGLGIANVHAALSMGVDMFETSVAGLGGCPFADHGHARRLYSPIPSPRGRVWTAWITWGGNGARAGRGPPGFQARREAVPIVPGVPVATPPALGPERPWRAEKAWSGRPKTPCGSAGEARLYMQRQAGAPSPLVPSRTLRPGGGSGLLASACALSPVPKRIIGQSAARAVTTISPVSPCASGSPVTGSQICTMRSGWTA